MFVFLKAQAASLIATIVDFMVTVLAVELLGASYVNGSVIGTVSGGIVNFTLGRHWVFMGGEKKVPVQAFRYFLVWSGNLALSAGGVFLLTSYMHLNYVIAKVLVSVVLAVSYNYFLQRRYVFR